MEQRENRPFLLKPCGKDYLWGGSRLKEEYHKYINMSPLAETWECCAHPDGTSIVANGPFAGELLTDVLEKCPNYLGSHPDKNMGLPILVKLIDAKENLSIQVHPDDAYAAVHENGSLGKTELWYVLDAEEDTELTYGFVRDMDAQTLAQALKSGTIEKYLQRVKVRKDDVFYVKAGTVHGIGAGALIAEIQENSNITYRLYDYNRFDKDGKKRELHWERAMEAADLRAAGNPRQPMRVLKYKKGCASELLCRCQYFQVERLLLNTEEQRGIAYQTDETSFEVLLCVDGEGVLSEGKETCGERKQEIVFRKGDSIFVPADSVPLTLTGRAQLLKIHC